MPKSYKELIVWQKSMKLAEKVYLLVKALPREETYALSDQIRRAAVSIPSNIAEGYARQSQKEFLQ
ncbi:MAG: four helix bundle protein, partial [Clostridia bacterium]|nr:four helix bundle protein [Clostridia bacterium]